MKSILISIKPKWCEKIVNGEKTIEVRKTAPKEVPFKAYIYCTKGKDGYEWLYRVDNNGYGKAQSWHGKVIGEFICDKVDIITVVTSITVDYIQVNGKRPATQITKDACLSFDELEKYADGSRLYGWHISDLKIYDKPKELSEFKGLCKVKTDCHNCPHYNYSKMCCNSRTITRPPQSYMFVEEIETR